MIIISLFFNSCGSIFIDVIKTGPDFPPSYKVDVFTSRDQITQPYAALAILHSQRFDCSLEYQNKIIKKAVKEVKKIGGDALIYYFDYGEREQYLTPSERCYMSGLAVKYVTDLR